MFWNGFFFNFLSLWEIVDFVLNIRSELGIKSKSIRGLEVEHFAGGLGSQAPLKPGGVKGAEPLTLPNFCKKNTPMYNDYLIQNRPYLKN